MFSSSELKTAALQSLGRYAKGVARHEPIVLPRITLPIYSAIAASFPEHIRQTGAETAFDRLSQLSPLLIAANDYCDIGLAAQRKRKQAVTQTQWRGLRELELLLWEQVKNTQSHIFESQTFAVSRMFLTDLITLSQTIPERNPSEWREYIELDNALFEVAALATAVPDVVANCGIYLNQQGNSYADLLQKYNVYLQDVPRSATEQKLQGLHAAEMVLKTRDDIQGYTIDGILGLPNLYDYSLRTHGDIHTIEQEYFQRASDLGFPSHQLRQIAYLLETTHDLKTYRARRRAVPIEIDQMSALFQRRNNTILKKELYTSGLLTDLFVDI